MCCGGDGLWGFLVWVRVVERMRCDLVYDITFFVCRTHVFWYSYLGCNPSSLAGRHGNGRHVACGEYTRKPWMVPEWILESLAFWLISTSMPVYSCPSSLHSLCKSGTCKWESCLYLSLSLLSSLLSFQVRRTPFHKIDHFELRGPLHSLKDTRAHNRAVPGVKPPRQRTENNIDSATRRTRGHRTYPTMP